MTHKVISISLFSNIIFYIIYFALSAMCLLIFTYAIFDSILFLNKTANSEKREKYLQNNKTQLFNSIDFVVRLDYETLFDVCLESMEKLGFRITNKSIDLCDFNSGQLEGIYRTRLMLKESRLIIKISHVIARFQKNNQIEYHEQKSLLSSLEGVHHFRLKVEYTTSKGKTVPLKRSSIINRFIHAFCSYPKVKHISK